MGSDEPASARAIRVAVTAAPQTGEALAERLAEAGFEPVSCPLVAIEPVARAPVRAEGYDWVIVTSRNAVDILCERLEGDLPRVAAIGPGTADALRARGIEPALVARRSTQEGLVEEIPKPAGRVLFAGAEGARKVVVRELGADFVPLYRTVEIRPDRFPDADLVVLASPSAARSFAAVRRAFPCVAIGPSTSAEARRRRLRVAAEAETHDLDGLIEAVKLAASSIASSRS